MTTEVLDHMQALRARLARLRALKRIIRDAPDQVRRDAAIIAYSRTLDLLLEDLVALDDMGLLAACEARLRHTGLQQDDPAG